MDGMLITLHNRENLLVCHLHVIIILKAFARLNPSYEFLKIQLRFNLLKSNCMWISAFFMGLKNAQTGSEVFAKLLMWNVLLALVCK